MKAHLSNYRQAPRKTRLIANVVRGKSVSRALILLSQMNKEAAKVFSKLIKSAVANAKEQGVSEDALTINKVQVGKGFTFKRLRPRARGSAAAIHKHTSNITLELSKAK